MTAKNCESSPMPPKRFRAEILKKGTASHELVFPRRTAQSVLVRTEPDPALDNSGHRLRSARRGRHVGR